MDIRLQMHYKAYRWYAEKAANPVIQHPLLLALLAIDASVGIQASALTIGVSWATLGIEITISYLTSQLLGYGGLNT